jgi:arylsulfatase A-like enzyme/predicted Zn-dependent protease
MKRPRRRFFRLVALLFAATSVSACGRAENLLVVTWDTTRADSLSPYGNRAASTPAAAALAREGVLFERAMAPAPLTLPSHASLFTGTYPPFHGIRENGSARLPAAAVTLAELLQARGYRTGAFVGAYVVDARWGLDQGFETYSGSFSESGDNVFSLADLSRRGDLVTDEALTWIQQVGARPFFAWVHLYDPHAPYAPPPPFAERFADLPYLGEIAFADAQLERLLELLARLHLAASTVVVLVGDHGEGFDEHGEVGHGLLLHDETLHVPLVIRAPGRCRAGTRALQTVSLVDVLPTIVELLGLPNPDVLQGRSLVPLLRGESAGDSRGIYSETLYPRLRFGWSETLALTDDRYRMLLSGDRVELFDLERDPAEKRDLAAAEPEVTARSLRQLRSMTAELERAALEPEAISDREAAAKLAALGYLGSGPAQDAVDPVSLPAAKEKLALYRRLVAAREALASGELEEAETAFAELARGEPNLVDAHVGLGESRFRLERYSEAAAAFRDALRLRPSDPSLLAAAAAAELQAGGVEEAHRLLETAVELDPKEPRFHYFLGRAFVARGDLTAAERSFRQTIALNPRSAVALVALAGIALERGELEGAADLARQALAIQPDVAGAHLGLAMVLARQARPAEAWAEAKAELELRSDPRVIEILLDLAPRSGHSEEIEPLLRRALERLPRHAGLRLRLAQNLLERGRGYEEAVILVEEALRLKPRGRELALAYFLLGDLYNRLGRDDLSAEYAKRGRGVSVDGS